jgi:hypothetical protein
MNNEFIPYEQALALKELGFDEPCFGWFRSTLIPSNFTEYFLETEFDMNESPSDWVNSNFLEEACSAPLYQQAFRWFREKYNLREQYGAFPHHTIITNYLIDGNNEENAELECLKKLIEIVKNK